MNAFGGQWATALATGRLRLIQINEISWAPIQSLGSDNNRIGDQSMTTGTMGTGETEMLAQAAVQPMPLTNPGEGHLVPALIAIAFSLACTAVIWLFAPYH